jgi:4-alpha-glucanotransferase
MVSPPILKREREEEQRASPLWVTGELGIPTVKPPPDTRSPEGGGREMDLVGRNKAVEVPVPEDSSTMEESVVTLSGQRRKEPLVGDLFSSPESVGSSMEKREDAVLGMDIYRFERNGARENAGSNPEDVSTGEGMVATLSGTANTKPLVGYWTQSPESVRSSVEEIEDKVPCRDTYPFEGN